MFALNPLKHYSDFYTWSHPMTNEVMAHQDGAVSQLIGWNGVDMDMSTEQERAGTWERFYRALSTLEVGYCAEFHWWREWDDSLARAYVAHTDNIVRGGDFARAVREQYAAHLAPYGITNEVAAVLVKTPKPRLPLPFGAGRALVNQARDSIDLRERVDRLMPHLAGSRIGSIDDYISRIIQSYNRESFLAGRVPSYDARFLLNEQLLHAAPTVVDGYVRLGDQLSKVLFVYMYPDAPPGWFLGLSSLNCAVHVSQIVKAIDTRAAMRRSEQDSRFDESTLSSRGAATHSRQIRDNAHFREFVAENNLPVFLNSYIIHLHGDAKQLKENTRLVKDWIETNNGQVRDQDYMQLPYFRAAQPGQGYRAPVFRPDHSLQVANMLPAQVYSSGDKLPESLRLGNSGQLVAIDLTHQEIRHAFTVAKTGSGKGVDKVATIAETYPYGVDWYIAEIGESYRWVVEAFGGTYTKLDPNESVVNPLPPYSVAQLITESNPYPLNAIMAGGTINALAFLLTDGKTSLTVHEEAAGQAALQYLYAARDPSALAPTLPDYLAALQADLFDNEHQAAAARAMAVNLDSFLNTTEGRIFGRPDNLNLSEGITGVDLKDVDRASPKLLKFYLVFLGLRFSHLAFAKRTPSTVLLDEMHKFVKAFPEVTGRLISELARMGRKDAAAIDVVTQGIQEIDCIEKEVLNSMHLRSLLFRPDEHDTIAERIDMPTGVLETWKSWKDPTGEKWRPAIRSAGSRFHNLHLTFPPILLDLASTTASDLTLKDVIGRETADPFQRLELLRQRRKKQ